MSAPTIDPSDVVTSMIDSVEAGVSDNLPAIGVVAGALLGLGLVVRLARKHIKV
jgi:hypothetical protein